MSQKILLVDDDEDFRSLLQLALQNNGYEVIPADHGEQALHLINTYVPDLMIVDLTMPVMNGWYFCMKVREDARYKSTPIIILSGLVASEAIPEKFEAATFFVPKPFDVFKLMEKIKQLLPES